MTVVIDIGCARYGGDYSVERLIEEFSPEVFYGFDPHDAIRELTEGETKIGGGKIVVFLSQRAAWTYDGSIGFNSDTLNSCLTDRVDAPQVACFDLAAFIKTVRADYPRDEIVLKIDAEGSEYELLEHLMSKGVDKMLKLAWVEFHPFGVPDPAGRRESIEKRISCELAEWRW